MSGTDVQNISLTAPDYGAQQMQIQRQQQLAQALQQQADAPIQIQSYNGTQAPIPYTAVLAKALSRIAANMQGDRAIKAQGDLTKSEQQAAIDALQRFGKNPDTTNQAADPFNNMAGLDQTSAAPVGSTITGAPTSLAQRQQMLPQLAMQATDNPYLKTAFPFMQDQTKVDIRAIGPEGLARVNPDGTVEQVAEGRPAAVPKQTLEEQFVTQDMSANPKETLADAEHKWAVARHVTDPNSGGLNAANNLTGEEITALNQGIASGQIDAGKVNSRTAKIMAHMYMGDPTVNQVNSAGHAAMVRSPGMQQRVMTAQSLPQILDNVRQAGKKLNFSDVAFAGKLQAFAKGQLNDPDFVNYMTQRNDAIMGIASVMRGVGMSDKAVEMESEAAPKTMSPKAFEGWYQAQVKSLEPRLKQYGGVALGPIQGSGQAAPASAPSKTIRFEDLP